MPRPFTLTLARDIARSTVPGGIRLISGSVELTLPPLSPGLSESLDLLCNSRRDETAARRRGLTRREAKWRFSN